jgi:hypothetical protein
VSGKRSILRRRVLLLGGAGALVTLGLCAVFHRPIIAHLVTVLAFRDAERLAVEAQRAPDEAEWNRAMESAVDSISSRYGQLLFRGFFSRGEAARRFPPSGLTREALPAMIVIAAFYKSNEERFCGVRPDNEIDVLTPEFAEWLDPVASLPGSKELLVNLLVTDPALWSGPPKLNGDGLLKLMIFSFFFCEGRQDLLDCMKAEEFAPMKARLVGLVTPEHWASVIRHTEHAREKVRAGSLLLLNRHPSEEVIVERAKRALDDPSEWVRLAAAGLLAIRHIDEGEDILKQGLDHERWEVRFWCVFGLFPLAKPGLVEGLEARLLVETDEWLKGEIRDAIKGLRPGTEPR